MKVKNLQYSTRQVEKTKFDKSLKVKLTKRDYVDLLDKATEWPMGVRIAAELFRSGVGATEFENKFHIEGNVLSKHVYEAIVQMDLGRGPDPDRVQPVRPIYLRYKSPVEGRQEEKTGRPSTEEAVAFVKKVIKQQCARGWQEIDFIKALRVIDPDVEPIAVKVEEDTPAVKIQTRKLRTFMIELGGKWVEAPNKSAAERLKAQSTEKEKLLPVAKKPTHCVWCKLPLNGTVVTLKHSGEQHMHLGCYYWNEVPQNEIPVGLEILFPTDGAFYEWTGLPDGKGKGGWKIKNEKTNARVSGETLPRTEGEASKPPEAVPDQKAA